MAKIYDLPTKWPMGPRGMALFEKEQVWHEKAYTEREWVLTDYTRDKYGRLRVTIEPVDDRTREATYSESYFRRHFEPRIAVVLRINFAARKSFRSPRSFQKLLEHTLKTDVAASS